MREKLEFICKLANEAKEFRKSDNKLDFNSTIQRIIDLKDGFYGKAELVAFITEEDYKDDDFWIDEFILQDLHFGPMSLDPPFLLEMLLYLGKTDVEETFKKETVNLLDRYLFSEEFYFLRTRLTFSELDNQLYPVIFRIEDSEEEPRDFFPNGQLLYEIGKNGSLEVADSYCDESDPEMKDFIGSHILWGDSYDCEIYGESWQEELLFRSCFIEDVKSREQIPKLIIPERLREMKEKSSKAWHLLLQLENRPYTAWFENE